MNARYRPNLPLLAFMSVWITLSAILGIYLCEKYLPMPPASLVISGGAAGGNYRVFGERYAAALRDRGIEVSLVESDGSIQNLQRVSLGEVDASFTRVGIAAHSAQRVDLDGVKLIAQIDEDPVWIFSRIPSFESFDEVKHRRFALGRTGSSSLLVATDLLRIDQVEVDDLAHRIEINEQLPELFAQEKVDIAILVMAFEAPLVRELLKLKSAHVIELPKAAGLGVHIPYFYVREVKGSNLGKAATSSEPTLAMLSAKTSLIARADLHPAMQRILMDVALSVHATAGPFHSVGEYPNQKSTELDKSLAARDVLLQGLPWLEDRLPPRYAYAVYRFALVALPLTVLAFLIYYVASMLARSLALRKISQLYGAIKYVEVDLQHANPDGLRLSLARRRIQEIEEEIAHLRRQSGGVDRYVLLKKQVSAVQTKLGSMMGR